MSDPQTVAREWPAELGCSSCSRCGEPIDVEYGEGGVPVTVRTIRGVAWYTADAECEACGEAGMMLLGRVEEEADEDV